MLKLLFILIIVIIFPQDIQNDSLRRSQAISIYVDSVTQSDTILQTIPTIELIESKTEFYPPIGSIDIKGATDGKYRVKAYKAWKDADFKKVIEELNKIVNKSDVDLEFLTKAYIKEKKWDLALNTGSKISIFDSSTIKNKENTITLLMSIGTVALLNKKFDMAIDYFSRIVQKHNPQYYQAYEHLGYTYYLYDLYNDAILNWQKGLTGGRNLPLLNYLIGVAYFKLEQLEQAKSYFEKIMPDNEWYLYSTYYLSHMAYKEDNYESAKEILDKIWIRSSGFTPVEFDIIKKKIYCNYILGLNNIRENPEKALLYFKQAENIISPHYLNAPRYTYMAIIRGILKRLMDDITGEGYTRSNAYSRNLINELEICYRESAVDKNEIKTLGNVIYLSSHTTEDRGMAARCFKIILTEDEIAENNFYCLVNSVDNVPSTFIDRFSGIYTLNNFYLLYNLTYLYFQYEKYDEALRLSNLFRRFADRVQDAKYHDELLAKHLRLRTLINEKKYSGKHETIRIMNKKIEDEITLLHKRNLRSVPEFIFLNEKQDLRDLVILYTF